MRAEQAEDVDNSEVESNASDEKPQNKKGGKSVKAGFSKMKQTIFGRKKHHHDDEEPVPARDMTTPASGSAAKSPRPMVTKDGVAESVGGIVTDGSLRCNTVLGRSASPQPNSPALASGTGSLTT